MIYGKGLGVLGDDRFTTDRPFTSALIALELPDHCQGD